MAQPLLCPGAEVAMWLLMLSLFCCKSTDPEETKTTPDGPDTLSELYDADSADRIAGQLSCADVDIGIQRQLGGAAPMSAFMPRSVLLSMNEPGDLARSSAAQAYVGAVIRTALQARIDEALAAHRDGMTRDEYRDVIERIWTADTYVSAASLSSALSTFCDTPNRRAGSVPLGPGDYGFACPLSPTPDCAADPPSEPWGCPPKGVEDCPDCPGLEEANDDLEKLEELFDAAHTDDILYGILEALVEALLESIDSGVPPTPASLVVPIVTAVLGPTHPGVAFYVDVLSATVSGGLAGGPLGGAAAMTWAILMGWGDFVDNSERIGDIEAARARLQRLKAWCEKYDWANRQAECKEREQALFERRLAECDEANASYDAALAAWEIDQQDCDAERAAVAAANSSTSARTSILQSGPYAFTAEAFEECCDVPWPAGGRCPEADSPIDPVPIPFWARRGRLGILALGSGAIKEITGGDVSSDPNFAYGLPSQPTSIFHWPSHPEILVGLDGAIYDIAGGGDRTGDPPWATFPQPSLITGITFDPLTQTYLVTDLLAGRVYRIDGPGSYSQADAHATGLSYPVDTLVHDDGRLLTSSAGAGGLVDASAGGDLSAAPLFLTTLPYYPQHFTRLYDATGTRIIVGGADGVGDGAFFDVDLGPTPLATGIFNPAGLATDPVTGQSYAASFDAPGAIYEVTGMVQGTDFSATPPHTTGMDYPEGMTWAPLEP